MIRKENHKELGMTSLMVTTILILVISLIILGFSQVTRRNQRETLDRQLSSQALYAAESGINAATAVIRSQAALNLPIPDKTTCGTSAAYPDVVLSGTDVKVTCLLVEPEVPELVHDSVTENNPTVIPVKPVSGPISGLVITWRPINPNTNPNFGCSPDGGASSSLPARASWSCGHGILRLEMTPRPIGNADLSRVKTLFLYPQAYGSPLTTTTMTSILTSGSTVGLTPVRCSVSNNDPKCMLRVTFPGPVTEYFLNVRSIYKDSKVVVDDFSIAGVSQNFSNQAMVDVTAKAGDVLKRLQVRVRTDDSQSSTVPAYGIETSESLCKRFAVSTGKYFTDPAAGCQ